MIVRVLAAASCFAAVAVSEDAIVSSALDADDACRAGTGEECGLELRQLRGEVNHAQAIIARQIEENKEYEEDVNVDVSQGEETTNEEAEEENGVEGKHVCLNHNDMGYWKDPGARHFHNDLTECGLQCNGAKDCSSACMENHGYTTECASCMGTLGWCSMSTCSDKCINKGCQSIYKGCFNGTETEKGKCTTYWMQHNCVTNKGERVYTLSDDCISCMHESHCGSNFEKCSGLELDETEHSKHQHYFRWWLNK